LGIVSDPSGNLDDAPPTGAMEETPEAEANEGGDNVECES